MEEPLRVLQVVTIMNRGGLETMLMNYYRKMDRTKIQFDFMVHRQQKGHYEDEILQLGGRIHRMSQIKPGNYGLYFQQLKQFFKEHSNYKIVHSHINENSSFVLAAAKQAGVPCRIAHSHLSDLGIDIKLPFRLYARFAMKDNPNHYFACSENAGRWLFGSKKPIKIMNNAVDVEKLQFNAEARALKRAELGLDNKFVIGHIGRFDKQKNHTFLIDIFKTLYEKERSATLVLVGDGALKKEMERKVLQLGIENNVLFLGVREDIPELLQAFDLFLFPSLFEGLAVVLIEAQAAGLPIIASDTISKEANITGKITYMPLQHKPAQWAEQILLAAKEREATASQIVEKGYDSSTMVKWLTHYYMNYAL